MSQEKNRLEVRNLTVEIQVGNKTCNVLKNVNFKIKAGEILGLVGESGCGKSMTSLALMGFLPILADVSGGEIRLEGENLLLLKEKEKCKIRGEEIAMIFQEPMSALNPLMVVGKQIEESYRIHHKDVSKEEAKKVTIDTMKKVGLSDAERLYGEYPHQLSGGMKQRIVIAMAIINRPKILIADEPTTALDVTIQAQILELLKTLNKEYGCSILFISHDLGVVRSLCDQIIVMYAGQIVERGKTNEILEKPQHWYTKGLLDSLARAEKKGTELYSIPGYVDPLEKRNEVGCPFVKRCMKAQKKCFEQCPEIQEKEGREIRCFYKGA